MKIYVASSWRNTRQPEVVRSLRDAGLEVYDFRNPRPGEDGVRWSDIDGWWREWDASGFNAALEHPLADAGFRSDFEAMLWADACVLVLPCGRSAHLEAGWFIGAGKPVFALLDDGVPELMYKLIRNRFASIELLVTAVCSAAPPDRVSVESETHGPTAAELRDAVRAILPAARRLRQRALHWPSPMAPTYFRNASEVCDHLNRAAAAAALLDRSAFGKDADAGTG